MFRFALSIFVSYAVGALGYGTILSPTHRSVIGSAATSACGSGIANYLAAHPGADNYDVVSHQGPGYNANACNLFVCGGYQLADNTGSVHTYDSSQSIAVTVNYTLPPPPGPPEYYDIYVPQLNLVDASTGYALVTWPVGTYPNSPQVITMDSIDTINAETYAINNDQDVVPPGSCANVGDCFLSWQLINYFRTPTLVSQRYTDAACIDIKINWV